MAARKDLPDRNGKSLEMKQRLLRLTEDENNMLNELVGASGMSLRDYIASLIEQEYNKSK